MIVRSTSKVGEVCTCSRGRAPDRGPRPHRGRAQAPAVSVVLGGVTKIDAFVLAGRDPAHSVPDGVSSILELLRAFSFRGIVSLCFVCPRETRKQLFNQAGCAQWYTCLLMEHLVFFCCSVRRSYTAHNTVQKVLLWLCIVRPIAGIIGWIIDCGRSDGLRLRVSTVAASLFNGRLDFAPSNGYGFSFMVL